MRIEANPRKLRYLIAYMAPDMWRVKWYEDMFTRHRLRGYDVEGFNIALNLPKPVLMYPELDYEWRTRNSAVLKLYEQLELKLRDFDVFILFNGANIHEDFVKALSTFNVYICWDDPESSDGLSKPVAKFFDFAFTGNVACINLYKSWGVENIEFLPFGCPDSDRDITLTADRILAGERDVDLIMLCERESPWRKDRLDVLQRAFPNALLQGRGWPKGVLPFEQTTATYLRSKIGWNVHNSVGPVNRRTYMLPANGVMQICDNKTLLGQIFKLNEEVIGFDTIDECVDLTHYYLAHEDKRREIAVRGWKRAIFDYSEESVWNHLITTIHPLYIEKSRKNHKPVPQQIGEWVVKSAEKGKRIPSGLVRRTRSLVNRASFALSSKPETKKVSSIILPYTENIPREGINTSHQRPQQGLPFEWPNMIALNQTVASFLGPHKKIIEIGSGTGRFAYEAARDPSRSIVCIEPNADAVSFAKTHRNKPNISFVQTEVSDLTGSYDLVVSVEVIEHVQDYKGFLEKCVSLAPRGIFTTPNKNRDPQAAIASSPVNPLHVREWTAGEFYWVLRLFYHHVKLYAMPNPYIPQCVPIEITSTMHPLIAVCDNPPGSYSG